MSANNEAEPAAAMAAAAPSAAASAASASEYLKRTCLICGCQTNQTINIYEPRSGPNIVQLIQAKFKFQPLNEDKFLCFSCNNWLINWHSLQALNSNDAESQSRSQSPSHLGNNSSAAGALVQQKDQPLKGAKLRPVAQVRPQPQQAPAPPPTVAAPPTAQPSISYNKRFGGRTASAAATATRKMMRHCSACNAPMVLHLLTSKPAQTLTKLARRKGRSQCRRCRESEISKCRRMYQRSLFKVAQLERELKQEAHDAKEQTLVKATLATSPGTYQRLPTPRVDGKVVAMFRRLGTTLSHEQKQEEEQETESSVRPPRIMSPAKERPRWTRDLDEDEILLEFDSVITEVLPAPAPAARRRLQYQLTNSEEQAEVDAEAEVESNHKVTHHTLTGLQLPQGLSITLI